ncbi:ABC transporter permease [Ruicaihuangia caeni]|uniref:ABC transporter permease n=1 Tax=Ruicaihuangia caeni TaxID=3042517 RepID=A0AAW6T5X4_9MICO|nr:ABC transporter permease [Klugiella sp. YN-L-19]MDI2099231.1 ABC transporter permease [Klugiella sp. YN-L-19]
MSSIITVIAALAAWEVSSRLGILPNSVFPSMSQTATRLGELLIDPLFWAAFVETVVSWIVGVLIAAAIGIPVGMVLGRVAFAYRSTRLLVDFLRTIPSIAVIPLITLLFGATMQMKIILIVYGAVWPLVLQMIYGVRDTDKVLVDTVHSYKVSKWRAAASVLFPSALPYLVTGMRISIVVGLLLAISAEMLGSAPGIGLELALAQTGGDLSLTYAYIVFIGLVAVLVDILLRRLSRVVLFWHASVREEKP